jgi:hypothetical protein
MPRDQDFPMVFDQGLFSQGESRLFAAWDCQVPRTAPGIVFLAGRAAAPSAPGTAQ